MKNKEQTAWTRRVKKFSKKRVKMRFVWPNGSFRDILGNIPNIQRTQKRIWMVYHTIYDRIWNRTSATINEVNRQQIQAYKKDLRFFY